MKPLPTVVLLALLGGPLGCPEPSTEPEPARVARELFQLARDEPLDEARIEQLFDLEPEDRRRAALYDALAGLEQSGALDVVNFEASDVTGDVVVDLAADLPGGGAAMFSVELRSGADGRWTVAWFEGPGVEWPPPRTPRDEGLSTSPPPQSPAR